MYNEALYGHTQQGNLSVQKKHDHQMTKYEIYVLCVYLHWTWSVILDTRSEVATALVTIHE